MAEGHTGDGIAAHRSGWSFAGEVADSFDEHVQRSVPLYGQGHQLVCGLTDFFVRTDSVVYELGCSTGELTLKMAEVNRAAKPEARFVGIDIEPAMIEHAEAKRVDRGLDRVEFVTSDVLAYDYEPTDLIVAYYTAQFVPPRARQRLIDLLYQRLNWGGALVLFEKVRGADARFQDILTGMYHDYKLDRGYSQEEVAAKSLSLRGVLEPFSTEGNRSMLERAGFVDVETVFRYLCFHGFLAIK
jgi:tRNA (cmo5U34)-methyltransferase